MSPAASATGERSRSWARGGEAQRVIDVIALRVAPALTGALIIAIHLRSAGAGLIAFVCMFAVAQTVERSRFPLSLLPAARLGLAMLAPLAGAALTLAVLGAAASGSGATTGDAVAAVSGAWLVLALGAWVKSWVGSRAFVRFAVVGDSEFAAALAVELDASRVRGYELVGFIGPRPAPGPSGAPWLGSLRDVRQAVLGNRVELLVCAPGEDLPSGEQGAVFDAIADFCLDLQVRTIAANGFYERLLGHVPMGTMDSAWFRYLMHPSFRAPSPVTKRIFDVFFAIFLSILFAPVLAVAAVAIRLGDGGPILYRQRRVGEHGRPFDILKLRTMRIDAEADGRARWSEFDDPRVTRTGRVLRRTHVDELPQLWNVLRGEMTMVGPRPERPELVSEIERTYPHYRRRQLVKPGLAGWAQLRCGYAGSDLGTAWKLCHDLYYVKHASILGDTLILAETAVVTFRDAHRSLRSPGERFILGERMAGG